MAFLNKKEQVLDIKLTRFGKNLLSRGYFKPIYYRFFDDDIIYDTSRASSPEKQNDSEKRIKDSVRLETQHTAVGIETSFDYQTKLIEEEQRGVFLNLKHLADPLEEEKILKYPLSSYKLGSISAPRFEMHSLGAKMDPSITYDMTSGVYKNIPVIPVTASYKYIIDRSKQQESPNLVQSETFMDLFSDEITFGDQSKIRVNREDLVMDLEEYATFYGLKNFEVEFYEETDKGSGEYVLITDMDYLLEFFEIDTDESVEDFKHRMLKSRARNIYSK